MCKVQEHTLKSMDYRLMCHGWHMYAEKLVRIDMGAKNFIRYINIL